MTTVRTETVNVKKAADPAQVAGSAAPRLRGSARRQRVGVAGLLVLLMLVGGYLRFADLGALTAQVDEGFQALAVQGILEHGYPKLESGMVYGRSPLFLYSQALSAKLFGLSEWSLRLPAAVFGVLSIPVAYVLGRRLLGGVGWGATSKTTTRYAVGAGLVLAAMMSVSAWEVEYARYGRFYTLFQLLYMLGVVAFMQGYLRGGRGVRAWRVAFWGLFVATVSVHDLGVMMGLCFWAVLPLSGYAARTKAVYFVLSGVCGAVWIGYNKLWRGLQASWSTAVPDVKTDGTAEIVVQGDGLFAQLITKFAGLFPGLNVPDVRFLEQAWNEQPWVLAVAALPAVVATVWLVRVKMAELSEARTVDRVDGLSGRLWLPVLLTAVWSAALQQFMLAGVAVLVFAAWRVRDWRQWLSGPVLVTLVCTAASMAVWVVFFWRHEAIAKHHWVPAVLNAPAVHQYFLQWFVPGWKRMLVLMLPAVWVVARLAARGAARDGRGNGAWLLLVAIAAPILVTSELKWQFSESRYFFHLYPLMLLVLAVGVIGLGVWVSERMSGAAWALPAVALLTLGGVIGVTKDLNPAQAYAVTTRDHGDTKDPVRSVINFPFYAGWPQDQKTASLAALDQIGPGDKILVVGPVHIAANYRYYLGHVDYVASTAGQYTQAQFTADGRRMDLVSQGEVVSTAARLREVAAQVEQSGGALWVFSDTEMVSEANWYLSDAEPALKDAVAALSAKPEFTGLDGKTTATRATAPVARLDAALGPAGTGEPSALAVQAPGITGGDKSAVARETEVSSRVE